MPEPQPVVVVGSINADLVARVRRLPERGETVTAHARNDVSGGKGANQAVALARLGRPVAMIGAVGDDGAGQRLVDELAEAGIDVTAIHRIDDTGTGLAIVVVEDGGENAIVVVPGANAALTSDHIPEAVLRNGAAVLVQLEIPLTTVEAAVGMAGGPVFLNPAPAVELSDALLDGVDYLIPNRTELGVLAGVPIPRSADEIAEAVDRLSFDGTVIVTLGASGAVAYTDGRPVAHHVPPVVDVVDTVGAGDAFCAAFADGILSGHAVDSALHRAVTAGAMATTRHGARSGFPDTDALDGR